MDLQEYSFEAILFIATVNPNFLLKGRFGSEIKGLLSFVSGINPSLFVANCVINIQFPFFEQDSFKRELSEFEQVLKCMKDSQLRRYYLFTWLERLKKMYGATLRVSPHPKYQPLA